MPKPQTQPSDVSEGVSLTSPSHATHERAALADDGGDARGSARTAGGSRRGDHEGTPPSNTVPSNDKLDGFTALRFGVDSLYLSYRGRLDEEWILKLDAFKALSQSDDVGKQALAQVSIGAHIFEVRDKGMPRFPFVLVDNCFFIKLNRKHSKTLPMAHVQISSEYLAAVGLEAAEADLRAVIKSLGLVEGLASVSRADLYLDFTCAESLAKIKQPDWITRAHLMAKYYDCRLKEPFTGWVIGIGGNLHARLYEKVVEIENKSHKTYLFELWQAKGWEAGQKVWRIEFQTEKQTLKELGIISLFDLLTQQVSLWRYLTHKWLRLSIPNPNDSKRDRWPNHPLWDAIAAVYSHSLDQPLLKRFKPARLPDDERLFVHGLGGLTSFMASRGIVDFWDGLEAYVSQAQDFHAQKGRSLEGYSATKARGKGRKFNTIDNQKNMVGTANLLQEAVEALRRERDAENGDA